MSKPEVGVRYVFKGDPDLGHFLTGVPARDLTDDDIYNGLTTEQKSILKAHLQRAAADADFVPMYERVKPGKGESGADVTKHDTDLQPQPELADVDAPGTAGQNEGAS